MLEANYYIGDRSVPYHLSVGAVCYYESKLIAVNHFQAVLNPPRSVYLLMRRTLKPSQSLESALAEGLREELGITCKIDAYLGVMVSHFPNWEGSEVEKTTLYFLVKKESQDPHSRIIKETSKYFNKESVTAWIPLNELTKYSREQGMTLNRSDFDESPVLMRVGSYL